MRERGRRKTEVMTEQTDAKVSGAKKSGYVLASSKKSAP